MTGITSGFSFFGLHINLWVLDAFMALLISVAVSLLVIPALIKYSHRHSLFDAMGPRKVHTNPVSRLGGVTFIPAIVIAVSIVVGSNMMFMPNGMEFPSEINAQSLVLKGVMCMGALALMYIVGLVDDIVGLSFRKKLVAQVLAAVMAVSSGVTIENLYGFMGIYELTPFLSFTISTLFIILVINAVNFIDGIDGLASALCLSALAVYGVIFLRHDYYLCFGLAICAMGTIGTFFYYNVFGTIERRTKIFMGDTGALTLGLLIAILAVQMFRMSPSGAEMPLPAVLAFTPLLVPCLDALRVVTARIHQRRSPFLPDRCHIHHKLLESGFSQRHTLVLIILFSAVLTMINFVLTVWLADALLLVVDALIWTAVNLSLNYVIARRRGISSQSVNSQSSLLKSTVTTNNKNAHS